MGCKCKCCDQLKNDTYWQTIKPIVKIQYIVLAGVMMPIILVSSLLYLIPGLIYCKDYKLKDTTLETNFFHSNEPISITDGLSVSFNNAEDSYSFQHFFTAFEKDGETNKITLTAQSERLFPCSNAKINYNFTQDNLIIDADETSAFRVNLSSLNLKKLNLSQTYLSGHVNISDSNIDGVTLNSYTPVIFSNSKLLNLSSNGSTEFKIWDSYAPAQNVSVAGEYRYVQSNRDNEPLTKISVSTSNPNIAGFSQVVCVPLQYLDTGCIKLVNKYWNGGYKIADYENDTLTRELTFTRNTYSEDTKLVINIIERAFETVHVCFGGAPKEQLVVDLTNRGAVEVIRYSGIDELGNPIKPPKYCQK